MVCALTEQEGSGLLRKIRIAQDWQGAYPVLPEMTREEQRESLMSTARSPNIHFMITTKPGEALPGAFGNTVAYGQTSP